MSEAAPAPVKDSRASRRRRLRRRPHPTAPGPPSAGWESPRTPPATPSPVAKIPPVTSLTDLIYFSERRGKRRHFLHHGQTQRGKIDRFLTSQGLFFLSARALLFFPRPPSVATRARLFFLNFLPDRDFSKQCSRHESPIECFITRFNEARRFVEPRTVPRLF